MNKIIIIKCIIFCIIFVLIMYLLGPIFTPKWYNYENYGGTTRRIKGMYSEPKNTIDIVMLGNSDLYAAVSNMKLWDDKGITSYHIGTPMQTTWISYYILKEFYKRQNPKLAIIDMDYIFEADDEYKGYINESIDFIKLNKNKIEMINDSVFNNSLSEKIQLMFPITRFHSRWNEINLKEVVEAYGMNNSMFKGFEFYKKMENYNTENQNVDNQQLYEAIPNNGEKYLNMILDICNDNNTEVLLIYVPTKNSWNKNKSEICAQYAQKHSLTFIDLNLSEINWEKYYRDTGWHLNIYGAEIVTEKLEKELEKYNLTNHKNEKEYETWNKNYELYKSLYENL